jgi:VanZ family protein
VLAFLGEDYDRCAPKARKPINDPIAHLEAVFDRYNANIGLLRSLKISRALDWLPAALSVAMIVAESTATMSAENTSQWLYPLWERLFGPTSPLHWTEVHHFIRKAGHFVGYGVVSLAFLYGWLRTLHRRRGKYRPIWRRAALLAVSCTLLIAALDEYHQSFLPSRTSSPIDVCIDLCGAIAAQLLLLTWSRFRTST